MTTSAAYPYSKIPVKPTKAIDAAINVSKNDTTL